MKVFLASTDEHSDQPLLSVLEEVFGVWSPDDAAAVGELAFAAGVGGPVYVVAPGHESPWFCSGIGYGGHFQTPLKAVAAFLRDLSAGRER